MMGLSHGSSGDDDDDDGDDDGGGGGWPRRGHVPWQHLVPH